MFTKQKVWILKQSIEKNLSEKFEYSLLEKFKVDIVELLGMIN